MAQRASGFSRIANDLYQTPFFPAVDALAERIKFRGLRIWEPAAGEGKLVTAMQDLGATVYATDIKDYGIEAGRPLRAFRGPFDFTVPGLCPYIPCFDGIATNPPYGQGGAGAELFIERGLERLPPLGFMALLLSVDFDSGHTRRKFFLDCPAFLGKLVLTKRIKWFDKPQPGKKKSGPSANHAWFFWQRPWMNVRHAPFTVYGPLRGAA